MKILTDIKSFIKSPDDFALTKPKNILCYSIALKIFSFSLMIFKTFYPIYLFTISILCFSISLFCDYKLLFNIDQIAFSSFKKNIKENPYKCGHYLGRICAIIIKSSLLKRFKGFCFGFKEEWNSKN